MSFFPSTSVLIDKALDIISYQFDPVVPVDTRKKVIVVGYGWSGKSFCDNINHSKYNVSVISKTDYMLNTPKLKNSLRENHLDLQIFPKDKFKMINEECTDINMDKNTVMIGNRNVYYDYLVLAVGSEVNDFNIKGVKENCFYFKNLDDLNKIKEKISLIDSNKDKGKDKIKGDLTPNSQIVILGAGAVGIELAFQMKKLFKNVQILEASDKILPMFKEQSTQIVLEELKNLNIKLLLNNHVSLIDKNIITTNKNTYYYDLAIWTCGIKPNPLIQKVTKDRLLMVDNNLRFKNNLFGIGDIVGGMGPSTAQNATQQGKYLAGYFNNNFEGAGYVYNERGKIIHAKDNMIIETQLGSSKVSNMLENLIDRFIG